MVFMAACDMVIHRCTRFMPKAIRSKKELKMKAKVRKYHDLTLQRHARLQANLNTFTCRFNARGWMLWTLNGQELWGGIDDAQSTVSTDVTDIEHTEDKNMDMDSQDMDSDTHEVDSQKTLLLSGNHLNLIRPVP